MITTPTENKFNSLEELCEWLKDGTTSESLELLVDHPWARTYQKIQGEQKLFLKDIPPIQSGALAAIPLLSEKFPDAVPAVVASDKLKGLLLMHHHGGTELGRRASFQQKLQMLVTYATLQSEAASQKKMVEAFPSLELDQVIPNLLRFLNPVRIEDADFGPARALDFFDGERCEYYFELFSARSEDLSQLIQDARVLPLTVNHCDLRSRNVAIRENDQMVFFDWDEAMAGPAGLSLHNFFSGCSVPATMLRYPTLDISGVDSESKKLLSTYMRTLIKNEYTLPEKLQIGLPGAVTAGVVNYLLNYARFMPESEEYRKDVAKILRRRLNDLLDLGDILTSSSHETTDLVVQDYQKRDRGDRACWVLKRFVERNHNDSSAALKLAELHMESGDLKRAKRVLKQQLERDPENAKLHRRYGQILLEELDLDAAVMHIEQAVKLGESDDQIANALETAINFRNVCRHAEKSGELPTIKISQFELTSGKMNPLRQKLAIKLFQEYGTLLIENAFSEQLVEEMQDEYLEKYQQYFVNDKHADALKVGSKRYMITVDIDGVFNSHLIYANPYIAPVIQEVLGGKMIMGGFNSVCSLPGSEHMRVHKDHPALFPESDRPDSLPSFAVTAVVGMRGFNPKSGTTRVVKRSHLCSSRKAKKMENQDPEGPPGTCLLMDYRLTHQGRANQSVEVRPILTMIYHRPWFRDIVNYKLQEPVRISQEAFEQVPEEYRYLFSWAINGSKWSIESSTMG